MKELLTYIIQSLVDHPDQVSVTERKADGETVYDEKEGRVIESLTTTLPAVWAVALKDIIE